MDASSYRTSRPPPPAHAMIPIHALLARIRGDPAFGRGEFVIGYYDRVARRIVHMPLRRLAFADHDHFACTLVVNEGEAPANCLCTASATCSRTAV